MQLTIPDTIVQSICLPYNRIETELLKELAIGLYAQELLPFGKACELAQLDYRQFSQLLGDRQIVRHYSHTELEEDLAYAHYRE
ncbi:UPF0175 family protein [Trichothermofontia sichuanensis B231]|uniref:UPF0175 family protein n=1 Tax=Trichothermofontia sichuanensis TaxID=3045816 RepID=UPI0022471FE3|nr:UPF0175 family protein [Trichothermofontia sichuanensis]UZQ53400.1 UPF0175 family protein [Trichothermofontia sichuanensis B231]